MPGCHANRRILPLAAALALAALVATPHRVEASITGAAGVSGGTSFTVKCRENEVLTGFKVKAGALIDGLVPQCAPVGYDGRLLGSIRYARAVGNTQGLDDEGAKPFHISCRPGAVVGFGGRAQVYLDRLNVVCGSLANRGAVARQGDIQPDVVQIGEVRYPGQPVVVGGGGGVPFGPNVCLNGEPAIGITGRAGAFIDQLALVCGLPASPLRILRLEAGLTDRSGDYAFVDMTRRGSIVALLSADVDPAGSFQFAMTSTNPSVLSVPSDFRHDDAPLARRVSLPAEVRQPGCATVETLYGGERRRLTVVVTDPVSKPNALFTLQLDRPRVDINARSALLTVTLADPAPASGLVLALSSSQPAVTQLPPSITIPAGSRIATVDVRPNNPTTSNVCAVIRAVAPGRPAAAVALSIEPTPLPQLTNPIPLQPRPRPNVGTITER